MAACAEPLRVVPGPPGPSGTNGTNGTNGIDAFTTLTANFTVPAIAATATATVGTTAWMVQGQPIYLQNGGVFYVSSITDGTHVVLQNPAAETGNVAAGTIVAIGNRLAPSGFKGAAGTSGAGGTGVTVATKGDLQTYAAAPANLPVGTNGQILTADSTTGTGLRWQQVVPNGSAGIDNAVAVANSPAGTETPAAIQYLTTARVTDTGAHQTVGGNARGVDAVDHQPARAAATQVASGNNSTIGGGRNGTSSAQSSTVGGGDGNTSSGSYDTVAGGQTNTASGGNSSVGGGLNNAASGPGSTISGGGNNVASQASSSVSGGSSNTSSGIASTVGGGNGNTANEGYATISGGSNNLIIPGATAAVIPGGQDAVATKYGQFTRSSGKFSGVGDAQVSELIWRRITTDATANVELFLDGGAARATVPNNTTWGFHIILSARRSNGDSFIYEAKGGIKNDAGNCVLVAAITEAVLADGTGGVLTTASVDVDADNANDTLRVRVTGVVGQTWRWVAHARLVEVGH